MRVGILLALAAAGCAGAQKPVYLNRDVHTVAVLPPFVNTLDVDASRELWPYVIRAVAGRGYKVLETDGVDEFYQKNKFRGDPEEVNAYTAEELARELKVDAIFYTRITKWGYKYLVVYSEYGVAAEFALVEGKTGDRVWQGEGSAVETSGGLRLGDLVNSVGNAFLSNKSKFCARCVSYGLHTLPLAGFEPKPPPEEKKEGP